MIFFIIANLYICSIFNGNFEKKKLLDSSLSVDAPEFVPSFQKKPTHGPDSGNVGVQMLHQADLHHPGMPQQAMHHGENNDHFYSYCAD